MEDLEYLQSSKEKLDGYNSFLSLSVKIGIFVAVVVLAMYFFLT
jgi:hypothetical protein